MQHTEVVQRVALVKQGVLFGADDSARFMNTDAAKRTHDDVIQHIDAQHFAGFFQSPRDGIVFFAG